MKHLLSIHNCYLVIFVTLFIGGACPGLVNAAEEGASPAKKSQRDYPHGQDEEDLKVQTELKRPEAVLDEKSIQARVLKNFLKKTGEDTSTDSESGYKSQ